MLKSVATRPDADYVLDIDDFEERQIFIEHLESRFLYLAADARAVLRSVMFFLYTLMSALRNSLPSFVLLPSSCRGWRPSYRSVLLGVRRKLGVPCSGKLSTEDLEVEIFLHLLKEYSRCFLIKLKQHSLEGRIDQFVDRSLNLAFLVMFKNCCGYAVEEVFGRVQGFFDIPIWY